MPKLSAKKSKTKTKTDKSDSDKKSHIGRKGFEWTPERVEKLKQLSAAGLNDKKIYTYFGLSCEGFYNHLRKNTELSEALKQSRIGTMAAIGSMVIRKALAGDLKAAKIFIEQKAFWREIESEITDSDGASSNNKDPSSTLQGLLAAIIKEHQPADT